MILYRIVTTQCLDTDTVYHLYRTSLDMYCPISSGRTNCKSIVFIVLASIYMQWNRASYAQCVDYKKQQFHALL